MALGNVFTIDGPSNGPGGGPFCIESDCFTGEAAVQKMLDVFGVLQKNNRHKPFETIVEAIYSQYEQAEKSVERHLPASHICCLLLDIGKKAAFVTSQMFAASGVAPPPNLPQHVPSHGGGYGPPVGPPQDDMPAWLPWVGGIGIAGLLVLGIGYALKSRSVSAMHGSGRMLTSNPPYRSRRKRSRSYA